MAKLQSVFPKAVNVLGERLNPEGRASKQLNLIF
jgi:hypothetical protein